MSLPKILFLSNTGWYLYNFRLPLAERLRERGAEVVMVSPEDEYVDRLKAAGFRWIPLPMERRSMNPLREVKVIGEIIRLLRQERPDAVHNFTIKCNLYGSIAARLTGVPAVINALTGLGQVYTGRSKKAKALRQVVNVLYRGLFAHSSNRVIFQNPDDQTEFEKYRLTVPEHTYLIRSSGVNTERFHPRLDADPAKHGGTPIVFTAARITHAKGIMELVGAARLLKEKGIPVRFQLAGEIDRGNPTAIRQESLESWVQEGLIEHLGHVDGMENYLKHATIVALPSYREGVPRTLVEAAAMGKPIVTTDAPGCKEIVEPGVNGLRVPVRDVNALADALETLLNDPERREQMGKESRRKAVNEFDENHVIARTISIYEDMGVLSPAAPFKPSPSRPQAAHVA